MSPTFGAVLGALIGGILVSLGYLMNGESPPRWLVFLGTAAIVTPIALWMRSKN